MHAAIASYDATRRVRLTGPMDNHYHLGLVGLHHISGGETGGLSVNTYDVPPSFAVVSWYQHGTAIPRLTG